MSSLESLTGAVVVVKFGGNAMVDDALKTNFASEMVALTQAGLVPIVVHGGGPQIQAMLQRLDIDSSFRAGLRVTSQEVLEVVRMVLVGSVQRDLVNNINKHGNRGVGMTGEDAVTLLCERHLGTEDGQSMDIGFVGDVVAVDTSLIEQHLAAARIPVISSIGVDKYRQAYNVNADAAAGAIAAALKAQRLVMMTDVAGLYADWPNSKDIVEEISIAQLSEMLPSLDGGMIPKMAACLEAVEAGVDVAHVVDGREPGSVTNALTGTSPGTQVTRGGRDG